ncbi:MAG: hypothetical protein H0V82_08590 [Candidatus Protochlamydia sp.]|nr:hypothetical protein [Candidatus Protochlamydia sp.]
MKSNTSQLTLSTALKILTCFTCFAAITYGIYSFYGRIKKRNQEGAQNRSRIDRQAIFNRTVLGLDPTSLLHHENQASQILSEAKALAKDQESMSYYLLNLISKIEARYNLAEAQVTGQLAEDEGLLANCSRQ